MNRTIDTVLLAIAFVAATAAVASAQDVDDLAAHCAELEATQSPGVVDCVQAVMDVESADSPEAADVVLERYYETAAPYDFQRTVDTAGEAGATMFDAS